ncbi:AAA family ATPase [Limobrevibacterium gyesilva]|uniref:AAA family ATPase n=1 Tax=Limobrevibacterium gyesilva TaxID=2991712 RepID=A0AA42CDS5_9PROT|nr:AAA family ATPase [Limobrevibacterium gyesilva]MCW3475218.1 AAA family ATPase [Limobrevibacterium gyesilva]
MYLDLYGLSFDPFELPADGHEIFMSDGYRDAISAIVQGIRDRQIFLALTGEQGAGKTTILNAVIAALAAERIRFVRVDNPSFSLQNLRALMGQIAHKSSRDVSDADVAEVFKTLTTAVADEQHVVLAIDDAHLLAPNALAFLQLMSARAQCGVPVLQFVFVGRPGFWETLAREGIHELAERIVTRPVLAPLSDEDAEQYIAFQLKRAGRTTTRVMTAEALSQTVLHARGTPGRINRILSSALAIGACRRCKTITPDIVKNAAASLPPMPGGALVGARDPVRQEPADVPHTIGARIAGWPEGIGPIVATPPPLPPARPAAAIVAMERRAAPAPGYRLRRMAQVAAGTALVIALGGAAWVRLAPSDRLNEIAAATLLGGGTGVRAAPSSAAVTSDTMPVPEVVPAPQMPANLTLAAASLSGTTEAAEAAAVDGRAETAADKGQPESANAAEPAARTGSAPEPDQAATLQQPATATPAADQPAARKPIAEAASVAAPDSGDTPPPAAGADEAAPASDTAEPSLAPQPPALPPAGADAAPAGVETSSPAPAVPAPAEAAQPAASGAGTPDAAAAPQEATAPAEPSPTPPATTAPAELEADSPTGTPAAPAPTEQPIQSAPAAGTGDVAVSRTPVPAAPEQGPARAQESPAPEGPAAPEGPVSAPLMAPAARPVAEPASITETTAAPPVLPPAAAPAGPAALQPVTIMPAVAPPPAAAGEVAITTPAASQPIPAPAPAPAPAQPQAQTQTAIGLGHGVEPPASSRGTAVSLSPAMVAAFLHRGDSMLSEGDVSGARLLYERAAAAGSGPASTGAGKTYDPVFLAEIGARGIQGNPDRASAWYQKAIALGDREAGDRLKKLKSQAGQ